MEKISEQSKIKFNPNKRFIGTISNVELIENDNEFKKVFWIEEPFTFDTQSQKKMKFGEMEWKGKGFQDFKFTRIRVELKKKWMSLDLFEGLEVFLFGNLKRDWEDDSMVMRIPVKSGYKSIQNMNFMTIEPDL